MAMTVEELLEAMRALIEAAGDEPLAEEDMERYEEMEKQVATLQRSEEIQKRQKAYDTPQFLKKVNTSIEDDSIDRAFEHYMRTGQVNQDLTELRAQSKGVDAAGGFLVPDLWRQKLIERLKAFGGVANAVETITTSGGEKLFWPAIDDTANSGVIAAEGTAPAGGADMVFTEVTLGAFRYTAPGTGSLPLRVSVELLQDSMFDIESLVQRKLGERIGRAQATHWVTGNGTTEPFGLDTNTTVTTTFTSAGITYAELVTAVHDVDPDYRMGAVWTFSDGTLELIRKLVDTAGRPLLNDADFGINAPPGGATLLGFPVVIDQAWPTYTDGVAQTFGAFGDLREGYVLRRVQDMTLIVNPFSRANEGQVEYTLWARADGVPQNKFSYSSLLNAV